MSRITKQLAEEIAKKVVLKKREEVTIKWKEIGSLVEKEYIKCVYTPIIQEMIEKHIDFLSSSSRLRLRGMGLNNDYIILNHKVIVPSCGSINFDVKPDFAKIISKELSDLTSLRETADTLQRNVYNALLELKTFKNVLNELPEIAVYLPAENKTYLPSVNLNNLRQQLKNNEYNKKQTTS